MKHRNKKGFTLAEFLVVLAVISIVLIASKPIMTVRKNMQNFDIDTISCLKAETFDKTTDSCEQAIEKCRFNSGKACDTIKYIADHGKTGEQASARQVLRDLCDVGGEEACKYFVDSCIKDSAKCDISGSDNDVNYYLTLPASSSNIGRIEVKKYAGPYLLQGIATLTNQVKTSCDAGGDSACIILAEQCKTNSHWDSCKILIDNCTGGSKIACKQGYMYNMNKTCKTIRDTFNPHYQVDTSDLDVPASGVFRITPLGWDKDDPDIRKRPFKVYCEMEIDDDTSDNEPPGGWTLVMKQKKGDGETLQGDKDIWTVADLEVGSDKHYLNDEEDDDPFRSDADQNFVSKGFRLVPVEYKLLLEAANESTFWTHDVQGSSAWQLFGSPTMLSEGTNSVRPDWFIGSVASPETKYPNGENITSASDRFNHQQIYNSTDTYCSVRWGWTANNNTSSSLKGSHNSCGGLGAYGISYGGKWMNYSKHVWQKATLYLYVK